MHFFKINILVFNFLMFSICSEIEGSSSGRQLYIQLQYNVFYMHQYKQSCSTRTQSSTFYKSFLHKKILLMHYFSHTEKFLNQGVLTNFVIRVNKIRAQIYISVWCSVL